MDEGSMIDAHIIDARGVYLRTEQVDPMGPQPPGAIYVPLPENVVGHVLVWVDMAWQQMLGAGVPQAPEVPMPSAPTVPESVTRAQGKAALINAGLWPAVLDYVAGITDATQQALAEVALNDTLEWRRDSPFLAACAAGMGLSTEQLDALFVAANQIVL